MNYIAERLKRQMTAKGKNPEGKDSARYSLKLRQASQRIFWHRYQPEPGPRRPHETW